MEGSCFNQANEIIYKDNIVQFIREYKPALILIGATAFGRSLAPRIAGALNTGLTADCTDLKADEDGKIIQIRPAFSDNILAHIKTRTLPQMATVRYKEFPEARYDCTRKIFIEKIPPYSTSCDSVIITGNHPLDSADITDADIVVAAGRGIRKKEDMSIIEDLARALGGITASSRALVDAGITSSQIQVGYSGHRVKPKVYIACGISGAPQHLAGMKDSDTIIAINKDASAPIFRIADIGYVGDLYEIVPMLTRAFSKEDNQ